MKKVLIFDAGKKVGVCGDIILLITYNRYVINP